jgi:hypothetical protein
MRTVLVLALVVGCTGRGEQGSAQPAPPPVVVPTGGPAKPAPGKARDRIDVVCTRALRCGTIARSQLVECQKGPAASRLTLVWGSPEMFPPVQAATPAEEQACLDFLATAPCRYLYTELPPMCGDTGAARANPPSRKPGESCTSWGECIDGWCSAQPGCSGVCKARSPAGGSCGSEQLCREDEFCWEGTCRARADVGATCGAHWQWCKDGLICDGYVPESDDDHHWYPAKNGVCSRGKLEGESCAPPVTSAREVCVPGLYCDWGSNQPVCRKPLAEGAECRWLDACADGLACVGLTLRGRHPAGQKFAVEKAGQCAPVLDGNSPCDPDAFITGCPQTMVCDQSTRQCRSTGHAGDPCASSWITTPHPDDVPLKNEGCNSANYCDVKTRKCKPRGRMGDVCTPQKFGVEDESCFLGKCGEQSRRCQPDCKRR